MTDSATETPAPTEAPSSPAPTSSETPAPAAPAAPAAAADQTPTSWLEALPEELRADKTLSKYESLEALARGHVNATKRVGKPLDRLVEIPEKPDDTKGWDAVYKALGRPDTADGYGIALPDGVSEADKAAFNGFVAKMHGAGATKAQIAVAAGEFGAAVAAAEAARTAATNERIEANKVQIKALFGDKHDTYKTEIGKLLTGAKDAKGQPLLGPADIEGLNIEGLGDSPAFMKLLGWVVDRFAEPESLKGAGENPMIGGAMTPYQATARLAEMRSKKELVEALNNRNHPQHKTIMAERMELLKIAHPSTAQG